MNEKENKRLAILGGGSWATALAKLTLHNQRSLTWYIYEQSIVDEFRKTGRNPLYLSDVEFPMDRIRLTSDVNEAVRDADIILLVVPSPYVDATLSGLTEDISHKTLISAVKGIVPQTNEIPSDYVRRRFHLDPARIGVVAGPCHAEEVALGRKSFLTVAAPDIAFAEELAGLFAGPQLSTITATDVVGIEYAAVLKNVYAIAAGIVDGLQGGDNFMAMLVSNAAQEMARFVEAVDPRPRDICRSVYLGDLLVTCYSPLSRNRTLGAMLGRGMKVGDALQAMTQTAEGYYASQCISRINNAVQAPMPIADAVNAILYRDADPREAIRSAAESFV